MVKMRVMNGKKDIVFVLIMAILLGITSCGQNPEPTGDSLVTTVTSEPDSVTTIAPTNIPEPTNELKLEATATPKPTVTPTQNLSEQVEALAEYTLPDSIGWYTRHFIVVKNNSNVDVEVSSSSIAYDVEGNMISAADAGSEVIGPNCISIIYEAHETGETIERYDTTIKVKESKYSASVIEDLVFTQSDIKDGVIFQVTNNGKEPAEFVEGYALFFKNGELVSFESTYFVDDDSEIKPDETITKQLKPYKEFDTVEFYLTGRR